MTESVESTAEQSAREQPTGEAPTGEASAGEEPTGSATTATVSAGTVAATRRFFESFVIAVLTSTGLYLVGSVYTDAYYGRMSIEATSLDLPATYIGLQSMHVLQALLTYPTTVVVFYLLYRLLFSRARWLRSGYDRLRRRYERAVLLVANLLVMAPLVVDSILAIAERSIPGNTAVSELSILLNNVILVLLGYVIWLSFWRRAFIVAEIRARRVIPIVLVAFAYLLSALIATADTGARAAEVFMLGHADSSVAVELAMKSGQQAPTTDAELLLVIARQSSYFLVERQTFPPSPRPNAYIVPFSAVDFAHVQRIAPAEIELDTIDNEMLSVDLDLDLDLDESGEGDASSPAAP